MDRLRLAAELKGCLLEVDRLRREGLAKENKLEELAGAMEAQKLLHEESTRDYL